MSTLISQALLPEFDHEMANLRKTLERVPEGKDGFKPHPKSMPLSKLAGHLAELPFWAIVTLDRDEFDVDPPNGPKYQGYEMSSRKALLEKFDAELKQARSSLAVMTDDQMMKPWMLKSGGQALFAMPRVATFRAYIMNHMVHHRAQLGVYLRMNDVPVPGMYGPSADES